MHHFDVQRSVDDDGLSVSSVDSGYDKASTTSLNSDGTPTYASYRKYLDSYGKKEFRSVRPPKIETNLKSEIFINLENSDQTDHRPINITINLNGEGIKVDKNECTINVMNKPSEEPSKTGYVANMSKNVFNAKPNFVKPVALQKTHLEHQKPKIEDKPIQVKLEDSAVKRPIQQVAQIQDSPIQSLKQVDTSAPPPPPPPMMMMAQSVPKPQNHQKPKLQKPILTPKTATDELKDSVINEIKTFGRSSLRKRSEAYVPQNNYQFTRSFANESRNNYNTLPKGWKTNKPEPKPIEEKTDEKNVNKDDPNLKKLVYNHYRNMLGAYNAKANNFISTLPRHRVVEDKGISEQLQSIASQAPPPPPLTGNIPSQRLKSEIGDRRAEPPLCVQNAMMTKDKKPFTYTPGGLNLAEIKSPSMARRIERNANAPGVSDKSKYPNPNHPCGPLPPSALAAMQPAMPTQVFPSGAPPPPPPMANPPPPPPPMQSLPTTKVATNEGVFERPDMTRIIPENPMALLKRTPRVERKSFVDQMNDFDSSNVIQSNGATNNQPQQRQESPQYTQETAQRAPQYSPQYTQQSPQYTQQSPQFTQQSPQYTQQSPQYTQQSPQYTQQSPQFMQQSPQYNQQSPQFTQQSPQYNQQSPQFTQQSPQYTQQSPQYTQQSPQYVQQSPQYNPQPKFPPQAQFNAQPQPYQNNRPQMVQEAKQPSPPPVQQKTSNVNLGSLYIPPIAQQQQQSSPSPQSPPMPKLNAAPKPWQNQKKQEQDVPAWAQRRDSPPKVQQQQQQQQQPPQGARIVVQPRLVQQPMQQPLQQPPAPRDGVEVVWVTQPEVYQHPGGPAPPHLYSQKSLPVQQQVRTPPVQQQQQVRTPPVQQQQQQQQGRIIPIQVEAGNQNNQPQTPNNDRNLNRQQSWTPTQSNSFKALQKMTRTDGDDVGDGVEHGPRTAQQYPAEQMKKMQLNDGDREFMNRVKQERYYKLAEENPRYRGGHIPSRVFRILDQSGGESLRNEEDPRYMGPAIPSKAFRLLQAMTQENPQENNNDVPQGSNQGPKVRRIPVQVENDEAPQPYVHPSEQTVPEPKKYTGSAIPSRAFRMVQAMTDLADDESCSENYERPQQWGSCYDYPPYYPYPPPPPPPQYYPQENPYYHSQSDSESERQVCTSCRKTPVPFWGYYPPYYQNGYETGTDSECEESQSSKQYYNNYWDPYYYSYWYPQMYYPYPSDYEGYSSCDEYYSKTPTITVTPSEENSEVEIIEQEVEDDIRDDVSEATVVESEYCESVQEQTDYDEENEGDVETYSTDDSCSVYAEEDNVIPHVLSVIFEETERFSRESSVATELSEETLVDDEEEQEEVVCVKLPLKLSYSEDTKEITQVEVDDFTTEYTLRSPSRTPKERSPCKFEDEEEKDEDISTTITLKFTPKEEEAMIVNQEEKEEEEIDFWSQINNDDDAPRNAYRTSNYSAETTEDAQIIRVDEEMGESQQFSNENCSEVIENKETNVVQSIITKESEADEVVNTKVTKVVTSYQCEDDDELIVGAGVLTSTQERKITSAKVGDIESTLDVVSKTHEDRKYAVGIKASEDQIEKCHVEDFKISNLVFEKEQLKQTLNPPAFSLGLDECFKSIANNLKLALGEFQPVEYVEEATETKTTSKRFTTAKCTENKETSEKVVEVNKACDKVEVEVEKKYIAEESKIDEEMNIAEEFEVDDVNVEDRIIEEHVKVEEEYEEEFVVDENCNDVNVENVKVEDEEEVNTSEDEESSSTDSSDSSSSSSRRSSSVEEKPPEQDVNNNQDFYVPTIKERIRALQNASRNSDKIKKEKPNILTTPRRSLEADNSEDDSGVTSDMSRHISDTECEFTELRKMSKYQRAATHSRLFKLLQEECEDEDEEDEKECRREKLSLPLSDYESFSSSGVTSPSTPNDKLVNELVQSLLKKKKGRIFRGIPIEKLQAAAYKILSEDKDLSSEEVSNYLSQNATAVQTPQEFYNEYSEYYKSFGDPNPQKPKHHAEKRTTAAS